MLFNKVKDKIDAEKKIDEINFRLEIKELKKDHELALREKEFEIKHLADERVKKAEEESTELARKVAVLEKENQMLGKITDLNADVIDVKKLVSDLIEKLPEIKINSVSFSGDSGTGRGEKK